MVGDLAQDTRGLTRDPEIRLEASCWAHFYCTRIQGHSLACRSRLEILRTAQHRILTQEVVLASEPEIVFVLLNPGSSSPGTGHGESAEQPLPATTIVREPTLLRVQPDRTQVRLIQVLESLHLNHGRLLNLSDIRESSSTRFLDQLRSLEHWDREHLHSIFSARRRSELDEILCAKLGMAVCGWGTSRISSGLANRCVKALERRKFRRIGIPHSRITQGFYHPLPRSQGAREQWTREICRQIQEQLPKRAQ